MRTYNRDLYVDIDRPSGGSSRVAVLLLTIGGLLMISWFGRIL